MLNPGSGAVVGSGNPNRKATRNLDPKKLCNCSYLLFQKKEFHHQRFEIPGGNP
jgi:hypothetical protein